MPNGLWLLIPAAGLLLLGLLMRRRRNRPGLRSLVALRTTPAGLSLRTIEAAAGRAFPGASVRVRAAPKPPGLLVDSNHFVVAAGDATLFVHDVSDTYVADVEEVVSQIGELRLRHAFAQHTAWIGVDTASQKPGPATEIYGPIAKLIAELLDADCTALLHTESAEGRVVDAYTADALRAGTIDFDTEGPPVIGMPADDERLAEATAEAQRRWPEFVAAFAARHGDGSFAVKTQFGAGDTVEWMWVEVDLIDDEEIHGVLANDPVDLPDLASGDPVTVRVDDIADWLIARTDGIEGGFSLDAIAGA